MTDFTYRIMNRFFRTVFWVLGLRIEVIGAEHIPAHGPAVLAGNHVGYLDFTLMELAASRRSRLVRFMAKRSIFDNPIAGPLMRNMGHISAGRTHGAYSDPSRISSRNCGAIARRVSRRRYRPRPSLAVGSGARRTGGVARWPRRPLELALGLRTDRIDQRNG